MKSVYDLLLEKKWLEACELAFNKYEKTGNVFELKRILPALVIENKFQKVHIVVEEIWKNEGKISENGFIWKAIASAGVNQFNKALSFLIESRKAKYSDPTGGIQVETIIYSLSSFCNDQKLKVDSENRIQKLLKSNNRSMIWPKPIGFFMLKEFTLEESYNYIEESIESLRNKQLAQLFFYAGVLEFENKNIEKCVYFFNECIGYEPQAFFIYEYHLANILNGYVIK
ncbi:hypothetical protein JM658_11990 [Joostella atrarenae]|uniref:Uncharacterized protein n=1 Tax=Joostella atrarenae TaxID=679257 RepID=A0ABS9J523_9FLAO|nr:hypothetical protein [Joostella atrarenae]MCF8715546.1 hypothetical protein [Joostella atrarenae]